MNKSTSEDDQALKHINVMSPFLHLHSAHPPPPPAVSTESAEGRMRCHLTLTRHPGNQHELPLWWCPYTLLGVFFSQAAVTVQTGPDTCYIHLRGADAPRCYTSKSCMRNRTHNYRMRMILKVWVSEHNKKYIETCQIIRTEMNEVIITQMLQ